MRAVAWRLDAAGAGTWRETGAYALSETGIVLKVVPPSPDRSITVTAYATDEPINPGDPVLTWRVQVRTRAPGMPDVVDDLADAAKDALVVHHQEWNGLRVQRCHRFSVIPMGEDDNRRHERADNYELILLRP